MEIRQFWSRMVYNLPEKGPVYISFSLEVVFFFRRGSII